VAGRDQDAQRRARGDLAVDPLHRHARVDGMEPVHQGDWVLARDQADVEMQRVGPGVRFQDERLLVAAAEGVEPADQRVRSQPREVLGRHLDHVGVARDVVDETHPGRLESLSIGVRQVAMELDQERSLGACDQAPRRELRQRLGDWIKRAGLQDDRAAARAAQRQLVRARRVRLEVVQGRLGRLECHLRRGGGRGGGVAAIDGRIGAGEEDPGTAGGDQARGEGREHGRQRHEEAAL
jgi:hypothetical protein